MTAQEETKTILNRIKQNYDLDYDTEIEKLPDNKKFRCAVCDNEYKRIRNNQRYCKSCVRIVHNGNGLRSEMIQQARERFHEAGNY